MSVENLEAVFVQADDRERQASSKAYLKYHALVAAIAAKYGYSSRTGAAVFAALSPNNDYHGNLRDTDRLLLAASKGLKLDDFKVSTYGANKLKAWEIAHGRDPLLAITALKTRSFFLNVADPNDPIPITIDGHMRNIWFAERLPLQTRNPQLRAVKVDRKLYQEIASGVRTLAISHDLIGNQAQSILWLTWRRLHGIKTTAQLQLWDRDWEAANLGFVCG